MAQLDINYGTPNNQDGDLVRDAWIKAQSNFTELYSLQFFTDRIISGSASWSGTGLTFDVIVDLYVLNGNVLPTANADGTIDSINTQVTLATADPTLPRRDVIAVDENEQIVIIQGTPSADPVKPTVNFSTQLEITDVLISAGATTPDGVSDEIIYAEFQGEPNEWTITENTSGARINLASNNDSDTGNVSIETINTNVSGDTVFLTNDTDINTENLTALVFRIKNKDLTKGAFQVSCLKDGVYLTQPVRIKINKFGYEASNTSTFHTVVIPKDAFGFISNQFNQIRLDFTTNQVFIDNIKLTFGTTNVGTTPGTYLGLVDTLDTTYAEKQGFIPRVNNSLLELVDPNTLFSIPTQTSELINNGSDNTSTFVETNELAAVAFNNDYNSLDNIPDLSTIYVPYTGASQTLNLGTQQIITSGNITSGLVNGAFISFPGGNTLRVGANNTGTGDNSVFIGSFAGRNNLQLNNTNVGHFAGVNSNVAGTTAIGSLALQNNIRANVTGIGYEAGINNTGSNTLFAGWRAGYLNEASNSTFLGYNGSERALGSNHTSVGYNSFGYITGSNNTNIGVNSWNFIADTNNQAIIPSSNVDATNNRITITNHGLTGKVYLFYRGSTGTNADGIVTSVPQQWTVIDVNTLEFENNISSVGTGNHTFDLQLEISNSTAIGANSNPTESNQIMLGDASITSVRTSNSSYVATDLQDFVTLNDLNNVAATGLEQINEGNGIGYRLIGRDPNLHSSIGLGAIDFSSPTFGTNTGASGQGAIAFGQTPQAIGDYSFAFGNSTIASGNLSLAIGSGVNASNTAATAFNNNTSASGNSSFAANAFNTSSGTDSASFNGGFNNGNQSIGNSSFTLGSLNISRGRVSFAGGLGNEAQSYSEFVIGTYGTLYNDLSSTEINSADRLVNIGYGIDDLNRNDAATILKNGNIGIGINNFEANDTGEKLQVNGKIKATDINFTGLQVFADDTAAGTGGLIAGDIYRTTAGDLKIKL